VIGMTITLHIPDLLNQVVLLSLLAGAFSLYDGILRSRGSKLLGIIEIIVAVLMLVSIFFEFGINVPLTTLAVVLEIVLLIGAFWRGRMKRGSVAVTIIALIVNSLLLLTLFFALNLPILT
jgi:hypothetical protein